MPASRLREYNSIIKDQRSVSLLFGYCYPSTYRVGMTSLATHLFYQLLNMRDDVSCERYFRYDVPSCVNSIESGRPLRNNHIVGFSLSSEEDILHVLQMLDGAHIPVLCKERGPEDPIVIAGGPVITANPEPYVDFIDAFVIGDGEDAIQEILDAGQDVRDRLGFLEALSDIAGVYVPAKEPTSISRRIVPDLDLAFHPTSQIVPIVPDGDVHEPILGKSFLIEVNRGCGHACAFCVVGHICRPRRVRSLKRQLEICEDGLKRTPVGKVAFIGSSVGAVDGLAEIGSMLVHRGVRISVPSLRADSITEELLRTLVEGGQKTLTIAPEVGGQELRYRIRKRISNETFYDVVALASRVGMKFLKAYFIFGLPEESLDDVHEIGRMIARFREIGRMRVTVSLNPFIPKAGTEFERKPQLSLDVLRERMSIVRKSLKHLPGVELEILDPRLARIQAALSVGDRRLGPLIRLAAKYGGLGGWRRAERETGIPFNEIVTGPRRQEDPLPWAFIS